MPAYKDLFPELSGEGKMDDNWWARFGLEESAMDAGQFDNLPAHDRLHTLMNGQEVTS